MAREYRTMKSAQTKMMALKTTPTVPDTSTPLLNP